MRQDTLGINIAIFGAYFNRRLSYVFEAVSIHYIEKTKINSAHFHARVSNFVFDIFRNFSGGLRPRSSSIFFGGAISRDDLSCGNISVPVFEDRLTLDPSVVLPSVSWTSLLR